MEGSREVSTLDRPGLGICLVTTDSINVGSKTPNPQMDNTIGLFLIPFQ